ncbi:alpha/beta fold hydrolase [Breoghania sp. L-A4]|nr:alpha/beta fold hydrolase [Breoghania sp. L-A4]
MALLIAGCASGRPVTGALIASQDSAPGAVEHTIFIATTRARDDSKGTYFSGERIEPGDDGAALDFASATVSVPPGHVPGAIEWPNAPPGDPAKDFVTRSAGYIDNADAFQAALKSELAGRKGEARDIVVFVHGFNTLFAEGVYRMAQSVNDTGFKGVPVLFTWASRGNLLDYVYDNNSATAARDALEQTLRIASASGAGKVHVLAHSMGNWVTLEALRQAEIGGHGTFGGKLGQVVLASPDIDVDVFKAQVRRLDSAKSEMSLLVSTDDRALDLSSRIAGGKPRLGSYIKDKEIAALGITVFDLTAVRTPDKLRHGKYAEVPGLAQLISTRLAAGDQLAVARTGFSDRVGQFGTSLGGFVGATAGIVITTPAMVLGAPAALLGRR